MVPSEPRSLYAAESTSTEETLYFKGRKRENRHKSEGYRLAQLKDIY